MPGSGEPVGGIRQRARRLASHPLLRGIPG